MKIVLTQTATWNPRLINGYRTRYTEAGGRYFEVKADGLYTPWIIAEITAEGEWIPDGFGAIEFRLSDVRETIRREVEG